MLYADGFDNFVTTRQLDQILLIDQWQFLWQWQFRRLEPSMLVYRYLKNKKIQLIWVLDIYMLQYYCVSEDFRMYLHSLNKNNGILQKKKIQIIVVLRKFFPTKHNQIT